MIKVINSVLPALDNPQAPEYTDINIEVGSCLRVAEIEGAESIIAKLTFSDGQESSLIELFKGSKLVSVDEKKIKKISMYARSYVETKVILESLTDFIRDEENVTVRTLKAGDGTTNDCFSITVSQFDNYEISLSDYIRSGESVFNLRLSSPESPELFNISINKQPVGVNQFYNFIRKYLGSDPFTGKEYILESDRILDENHRIRISPMNVNITNFVICLELKHSLLSDEIDPKNEPGS